MLDVHIKHQSQGAPALDVTFQAPSGVTSLFGRSGAGKTTVINVLAGLIKPQSGHIEIDGEVIFDATKKVNVPPDQRRFGYVFQDAKLFPHLNVESNLRYGYNLLPSEKRKIVFDDVVSLLKLDHLRQRRTRNLSGGESQRVAIGRALLTSPRLLLLDEPLASLDGAHRREIMPYLENVRQQLNIPIIYVTHQIDEIIRLADQVVVIDDGRVMATGAVEEVLSRLDLRPLTGRFDAGAALTCKVGAHDRRDQLTRLEFSGGAIVVPFQDLPEGREIRIRIRARDITLSLTKPTQTSVLNILEGQIIEIAESDKARADVLLQVGKDKLWASVTKRSVRELGLEIGVSLFAMIKSVAVDRHSIGGKTNT